MGRPDPVDRSRRPPPGPAPRISLPAYRRTRLDNGLTVLVVRHDDLPEISARLVIPFGATDDPDGLAGTALLTARALTEGTSKRSAREVAGWLDHLGARFSVDVDHDSTVLSLHFLSRVLDGAFEFLSEVVTQPAFAPDEVERVRDERLDEIASGLDEPRVVASIRWREACFRDHPYSVRAGGTEQSVPRTTPDVLETYHQRFYRPRGATLILVGDLPATDALQDRLVANFGAWTGTSAHAGDLADASELPERRIHAIPWPGPQSEIRVGGVAISRLDPDYPAVLVMNAILGGLFSSRLNMNLREDKGWTYGVSSRLDAGKRRGPLLTATAVDALHTVDATREILGEFERMKADPPSDNELSLAVNALTLSLPRLFETTGQVSRRVMQQVIYGLPDDYWEAYADRIRSVSRADIARVAARLLDTQRTAVVIVGPVRDHQSQLGQLGRVEFRDKHGNPAPVNA